MKKDKSKKLFEQAQRYMPGGVNSPARAFRAVGGEPVFIERARGNRIYDVDGNEYIDYVCSWGPLILGHAYPPVVEALKKAVERGTTYGAPTELETQLAQMICDAVPSIEMVRFVSSGTEAAMSALRLARGYTQRDMIVKFTGGYHGHGDALLVKAGSGATTLGTPDSAGVPSSYAEKTLLAPFNDIEAIKKLFQAHPQEIAAVIVEPVAGNMGVVPPQPGFLDGLRQLTSEYGALLIFDEVITGFRVAYGGAQTLYGVTPDLTCLGKIIGGGLPVGAYGGKGQIMEMVSPLGPVYQAGTLSGNPLAMTAGLQTLKTLQRPQVYQDLEEKSSRLAQGLTNAAQKAEIPIQLHRVGSMMTSFFTDKEVVDYEGAKLSDTPRYAEYFRGMLNRGIYLAPSQFEALFVSLAHTEDDIDATVATAGEVFQELAASPSR
ncbi:MAG: glutamate-1-semialdehyde 2,1-aminomutase [Dehalococcoidia bacterium]